ncbi:hypothetical protein BN1232_05116 [Mycobacterium lentiflavum]|jgi:hypothetical protein|uniref:Uncharacterized protein n=1 Tax=Mycobacterium lentiflavum TaxID=141349 RepID=A0A0E3WDQ4_MYCLN|nr:hypothetical protein [Mycobacterium lentiflavum]CQD21008.1 hypothetical protein BN1232_05116 [Mycobacterium lentiflavum]
MSQIILNPIQWMDLSYIDDVQPIDDDDAECLEEIRLVLERHKNLDRFGIALLHSHFQIADDELLLETTDVEEREHWVRPVKKSHLSQMGLEARTTILRFDTTGHSQACGCAVSNHGHTGTHTPPRDGLD